jgi:hypothetical protein
VIAWLPREPGRDVLYLTEPGSPQPTIATNKKPPGTRLSLRFLEGNHSSSSALLHMHLKGLLKVADDEDDVAEDDPALQGDDDQ